MAGLLFLTAFQELVDEGPENLVDAHRPAVTGVDVVLRDVADSRGDLVAAASVLRNVGCDRDILHRVGQRCRSRVHLNVAVRRVVVHVDKLAEVVSRSLSFKAKLPLSDRSSRRGRIESDFACGIELVTDDEQVLIVRGGKATDVATEIGALNDLVAARREALFCRGARSVRERIDTDVVGVQTERSAALHIVLKRKPTRSRAAETAHRIGVLGPSLRIATLSESRVDVMNERGEVARTCITCANVVAGAGKAHSKLKPVRIDRSGKCSRPKLDDVAVVKGSNRC